MIFYWLLCVYVVNVHIMSSSLMHIHKPTECLDAFPYSSLASSLCYFFLIIHLVASNRIEQTIRKYGTRSIRMWARERILFFSFRIRAHERFNNFENVFLYHRANDLWMYLRFGLSWNLYNEPAGSMIHHRISAGELHNICIGKIQRSNKRTHVHKVVNSPSNWICVKCVRFEKKIEADNDRQTCTNENETLSKIINWTQRIDFHFPKDMFKRLSHFDDQWSSSLLSLLGRLIGRNYGFWNALESIRFRRSSFCSSEIWLSTQPVSIDSHGITRHALWPCVCRIQYSVSTIDLSWVCDFVCFFVSQLDLIRSKIKDQKWGGIWARTQQKH